MKLKKFMKLHRWTDTLLKDVLGISREYVNRIKNEKENPSVELQWKIKDWSRGEVDFKDWKGYTDYKDDIDKYKKRFENV